MITKEEIEEAREVLWDYAIAMNDEEMIELLSQMKNMIALVLEFVEEETI